MLYASLFTHINELNIMNAGVDHETEMWSSFLVSSVMLDSNSYLISGCFSQSPLFHATVVAGVNLKQLLDTLLFMPVKNQVSFSDSTTNLVIFF